MDDNNQDITRLGNTGDLFRDLNGADFANISKAVEDGVIRGFDRAKNPTNTSQSIFQDRKNEMELQKSKNKKASEDYKRTGNFIEDFETGVKDAMLDAIAGGDFKKGIQGALTEFTKQFGYELKDLPHELGKEFGKQFSESGLGKSLTKQAQKGGERLLKALFNERNVDQNAAKNALSKVFNAFLEKGSSGSNIASQAMSNAGEAGEVASHVGSGGGSAGAAQAGGALAGAGGGNATAGMLQAFQGMIPVAAALAVFVLCMRPVFEALVKIIQAWGRSFNRDEDMRKKRLENAQKRMEADMEYLAREPFEILINAAKKWEDTWDANLAKVSLTQGYTKEDVYELYSSVAEKLNSEGLGSYIAATDVISNLGSILETGLSGKIAEEFAYQATRLNATIPTENFMGYASTYAQLASYAVSQGMDQADAIEYANEQLQLFASNLLYSSRTLTGGFTTGLKDAQSLFKDAVDIAQSAKTGNVAEISGTLTSISGIIGAVAPDLAQSLVQNVVQAAIGGNSDTIVALRSLAGINAGNTDFLRALAMNPQAIFSTLFMNLANMQNMAPDNYMEVAEGLASVFGVDMKAFARVDFAQLAASIAAMNVNYDSLNENLDILSSGEATMSTEQMKLQEINNAILEEGLTYVIDSEAGRMIQQHMWDEQIADQLANTEYAVSLQGAALTYLEGMRHTVANILAFLNPIGYLTDGIERIIATNEERKNQTADIAQILELGKVGAGNAKVFNDLTNFTGRDLELVRPLVEMMGGTSAGGYNPKYVISTWLANQSLNGGVASVLASALLNPALAVTQGITANSTGGLGIYSAQSWNSGVDDLGKYWAMTNDIDLGLTEANIGTVAPGITSKYSGFNAGKSVLSLTAGASNVLSAITRSVVVSATDAAQEAMTQNTQDWLDSAKEYAESGRSEAEWLASAKDFGIADLAQALEDAGLTLEQAKGYYGAYESGVAGAEEQQRKDNIQEFIEQNRKFWDYETGSSGIYQTAMWLPFLNDNFKPFFDVGARFDQRMDLIDAALTTIQLKEDRISEQIGDDTEFTVISVLQSINTNLIHTFVDTGSSFQKCLADWMRYIAATKSYQNEISNAQAWNDLKNAEGDAQRETLLALANAMNVFSADELKKLDPQMQANALLGEIVILLQTVVQQNNNAGGSGFSLLESMSALGFGATYKTGT